MDGEVTERLAVDDVEPDEGEGWSTTVAATVLLVAITAFHYLTDPQLVEYHSVYRRLYYVPIVLFAFSYGMRGGLGAAVFACVAYFPHAFLLTHQGSPAGPSDKVLEMVLYLCIGGLTGWLVRRRRRVRGALRRSLAERDALEQKLVRAGKLSALGQLTGGLAHEIRNPLASILGSAESLAEEFDEDHPKHRLGQVMLEEIDRLNEVVEDFLAFARPGEPERVRADLREVAEEVRDLTARQAREREVDIEVVVEPGELVAEVDRSQVSQVVLNLFLNAYQAFDRQEPPVQESTVWAMADERKISGTTYVCLGVRDNAGGVPEEMREKIFDPYFTTRDEGTGLGLSISGRIVDAHGGFIELEVDKTAGRSTFWVCLPES
jgi:signal transduction histidine kinase